MTTKKSSSQVRGKPAARTKKRTTRSSSTPKKVAKTASTSRVNIENIKDVKDVKKVLKTLEKRLKTVERDSTSIIDKLVENLRIKELYAKGNKMVSQAYKYTRDKCVGK